MWLLSCRLTSDCAAPAASFLNANKNLMPLNDSFVADVNKRADSCGYTSFMKQALTFPPKGKFTAPNDRAPGMFFSCRDLETDADVIRYRLPDLGGHLDCSDLRQPVLQRVSVDLDVKRVFSGTDFNVKLPHLGLLPLPLGRDWIPLARSCESCVACAEEANLTRRHRARTTTSTRATSRRPSTPRRPTT